MFLEELLLDSIGYGEPTTDDPGHDLAKRGCVVLRLRLSFDTFDAVRAKILAQSSQRPFVKKTGEIVGSVGKQFAAPNSDEKGEVLACDPLYVRAAGCLRKSHMREAKRGRITTELGNPTERRCIR